VFLRRHPSNEHTDQRRRDRGRERNAHRPVISSPDRNPAKFGGGSVDDHKAVFTPWVTFCGPGSNEQISGVTNKSQGESERLNRHRPDGDVARRAEIDLLCQSRCGVRWWRTVGDTAREATSDEVKELKAEARQLKKTWLRS
jgi:hypothetical protein